MFFVALMIVLVLAAVAFATSGRTTGPSVRNAMPQFMAEAPAAVRRRSFRREQLEEEAEAIADEYSARADAEWRKELRAKAAAMLDPAP
jgi:hypothetical protein